MDSGLRIIIKVQEGVRNDEEQVRNNDREVLRLVQVQGNQHEEDVPEGRQQGEGPTLLRAVEGESGAAQCGQRRRQGEEEVVSVVLPGEVDKAARRDHRRRHHAEGYAVGGADQATVSGAVWLDIR